MSKRKIGENHRSPGVMVQSPMKKISGMNWLRDKMIP